MASDAEQDHGTQDPEIDVGKRACKFMFNQLALGAGFWNAIGVFRTRGAKEYLGICVLLLLVGLHWDETLCRS